MSQTSLRLRVVPRYPAKVTATDGLKAVRSGVDLVVKSDYSNLVQVPTVTNPDKTFMLAWDSDIDNYQSMSFTNVISNIQDAVIGPPLAAIDATNPGPNQVVYFTDVGVAATFTASEFVRGIANSPDSASFAAQIGAQQSIASITALKAVAPTSGQAINLIDQARSGDFAFRLGDYSTQVAADTQGAIYVKANSIAATVGAWVRQGGWTVSGINVDWARTSGASDDTVAIQAALNLAAFLGIKRVYGGGGGTLNRSATISVPANILFEGDFNTTLFQINGAAVGDEIALGSGAALRGWIIDGNRTGNADNANHVTVRVGNSSDCEVRSNIIKNSTGYGVVVNTGLRAKIASNTIFNFYQTGIACFGNSSAHSHGIEANYIHDIGWSGVLLQYSDYTRVVGNTITGQCLGTRAQALTVSTSGTTVTWVSGPTFTTVKPGNFVVINNGAEFRVTAVTPTQLTVDSTVPTLSNVGVSVGSGDLIGVIATSFSSIVENIVSSTATYLFGYSLGPTAVQCSNNIFARNILNFAGKNAINISGVGGAGFLDNSIVTENKIFNAGYGLGIGSTDRIAIFLSGGTPGTISNMLITDNSVISYAGTGQTTYWLGTDGLLSYGSVHVSDNKSIGVANFGISNDVVNFALSAGWGSTATSSVIVSHGSQLEFTITCSGTGFAANPTFTIQKIVDTANNPPLPTVKIVNTNSGPSKLNAMYGENLSLVGQWKATMAGTPASGDQYTFIMKAA